LSTPSSPASAGVADDFIIDTPGGWHVSNITVYSVPLAAPGPGTAAPPCLPRRRCTRPTWSGATRGAGRWRCGTSTSPAARSTGS
jgi:hypothetical protein